MEQALIKTEDFNIVLPIKLPVQDKLQFFHDGICYDINRFEKEYITRNGSFRVFHAHATLWYCDLGDKHIRRIFRKDHNLIEVKEKGKDGSIFYYPESKSYIAYCNALYEDWIDDNKDLQILRSKFKMI